MRIPGTQRIMVQGREVPQRRSPAPSTKASTLSSFGTLPSLPSRRRSTRASSAVGAPAAAAPSRPSTVRAPAAAAPFRPAEPSRRLPEEPPQRWFPTSRDEVPKPLDGLKALADKINAAGGLTEEGELAGVDAGGKPRGKALVIYATGLAANVRRNFLRRLDLKK